MKTSTTVAQLGCTFELMKCPLTGKPAISKSASGYRIRVLKGHSYNSFTTERRLTMDYFALNNEGIITASPRGFAKEYNKKVKVRDIEKAYQEQDT